MKDRPCSKKRKQSPTRGLLQHHCTVASTRFFWALRFYFG